MFSLLIVIVLGWGIGLLVNYLVDVLPYKRRIAKPFCQNCGETQPWLNYFIWPRRCFLCWQRRSLRTWLVEFVAISATIWLWISPSPTLGFSLGLLLLTYFGVVAIIDLEHRLILHPVSVAGAILGFFIGVRLHDWYPTVLGGLAGFGAMLLLYILGNLFGRVMARKRGEPLDEEALGFGDVNLSGVLGLILGWPGIVLGLILAIVAGGLVSLIYLLVMIARRRYRAFVAIPYGPFLIAGAVLLLYFRDIVLFLVGQ